MSKKDFGGKITLRAASGQRFSLRGTLSLETADVSAEAMKNQDGSLDRTFTLKAPKAEISFSDRGYDYDSLLTLDRQNFTFDEEHTGVTYYFTQAFFTGTPTVNRMNGETTGLSIEAERMTRRD